MPVTQVESDSYVNSSVPAAATDIENQSAENEIINFEKSEQHDELTDSCNTSNSFFSYKDRPCRVKTKPVWAKDYVMN